MIETMDHRVADPTGAARIPGPSARSNQPGGSRRATNEASPPCTRSR
ncbi:hypothetical protein OG871_33975 [Kitasatospora sp. NBC_00374]